MSAAVSPSAAGDRDDEESVPLVSHSTYKLSDPKLRGMLILCLTSFFSVNFSVNVGSSFFPQVAANSFQMSSSVIGLILAVYPAALGALSPVTILLSTYFGRFNVVLFGLVLQVLSLFIYGASSSVFGFFVSNLIQGFAGGCVRNATNSLFVANVENLSDVLSLQQMASEFGAIIATFAGGWLFSKFGFSWTFYSTAIIIAVSLVSNLTVFLFCFNNWKELDRANQNQLKTSDFLAILRILLDRVTVACVASITILALMFGSLEVILAPHLQMALNIDTGFVGLLMIIPGVGSGLSAGIAGYIVKWLGARNTIAVTVLLCGVSNLLLGPMPIILDRIPGPAVAWTFMVCGLVLLGLSIGIGFIPILPVMRDSSEARVKEANLPTAVVSDVISAIFMSAFAVGLILGPIIAGALMQVLPKRQQVSCVGNVEQCSSAAQWASFIFGSLCILCSVLVCITVPNAPKTKTLEASSNQEDENEGDE
jgi:MFS family permease